MERKSSLKWVVGGLLAFSSGAHAQGYFPFDEIPGLDSEPTVQIDLDPATDEYVRRSGERRGSGSRVRARGHHERACPRLRGHQRGGGEAELLKFVDDTSRSSRAMVGNRWSA